jgi:hypothetical protein
MTLHVEYTTYPPDLEWASTTSMAASNSCFCRYASFHISAWLLDVLALASLDTTPVPEHGASSRARSWLLSPKIYSNEKLSARCSVKPGRQAGAATCPDARQWLACMTVKLTCANWATCHYPCPAHTGACCQALHLAVCCMQQPKPGAIDLQDGSNEATGTKEGYKVQKICVTPWAVQCHHSCTRWCWKPPCDVDCPGWRQGDPC